MFNLNIFVDESSFWISQVIQRVLTSHSFFFNFENRQIFIDAMIGMPNALAMDFEDHQLCWTDGGAKMTSKVWFL